MSSDKLQTILDNARYITGVVSFQVVEMPSGHLFFCLGDWHIRYTGKKTEKSGAINVIDFLIKYCFSNDYPTDFYHEECLNPEITLQTKIFRRKQLHKRFPGLTPKPNKNRSGGELFQLKTEKKLIISNRDGNSIDLPINYISSFNVNIRALSQYPLSFTNLNVRKLYDDLDFYKTIVHALLLSSVESFKSFCEIVLTDKDEHSILKRCFSKSGKEVVRGWNSLSNKRLKKEVEDIADNFVNCIKRKIRNQYFGRLADLKRVFDKVIRMEDVGKGVERLQKVASTRNVGLATFLIKLAGINFLINVSTSFRIFLPFLDLYLIGKSTKRMISSNTKELWAYTGQDHNYHLVDCLTNIFGGKLIHSSYTNLEWNEDASKKLFVDLRKQIMFL